jgi:hypothetical protein
VRKGKQQQERQQPLKAGGRFPTTVDLSCHGLPLRLADYCWRPDGVSKQMDQHPALSQLVGTALRWTYAG